jgi:pimeloyl-ACP methyl ester carboxylesterase
VRSISLLSGSLLSGSLLSGMAIVLAAGLVAGCGTGIDSLQLASAPQGPDDPAFYQAPSPGPGTRPGQVIWMRRFDAPAGSRGYQMLYWSTDVRGKLIAVSGAVVVPTRRPDPPPKIVAWAHATNGLGDSCAPSRGFRAGYGGDKQVAAMAVRSGNVFVETDYQGLGTPGDSTYIVGQSEGRNVLDSIRAAAWLTGMSDPIAVVIGHSQGGGAALFTAEMQPTYAPDIKLVGAVGVASPGPLTQLAATLDGGKYSGYTLMAIEGFVTAYPELRPLLRQLTPRGRQALAQIGDKCAGEILSSLAGTKQAALGTSKVIAAPAFRARLAENSAGRVATRVPILLVAGEADDTIPVDNSRALLSLYCALETPVEARFVAGAGHVDVLGAEIQGIATWSLDRLRGSKPTNSCPSRLPQPRPSPQGRQGRGHTG